LQRTSPPGAEEVDPLIFVDGVRFERGGGLLESLDPGRIERIEVLKGAAAARLFTEEAVGGVIQIFLKAEGGER
jgi:outer membrane cobalamin receptor